MLTSFYQEWILSCNIWSFQKNYFLCWAQKFFAALLYCVLWLILTVVFLNIHRYVMSPTVLVCLALVFQNHTSAQYSSGAQWRSGSLAFNDLYIFQLTENSLSEPTSWKHWQGAQDRKIKLKGTVIASLHCGITQRIEGWESDKWECFFNSYITVRKYCKKGRSTVRATLLW